MAEHSKQGKKRTRRETEENESLRIFDECFDSEQGETNISTDKKKKTRGPTKLLVVATGKKDRREIEWNEFGQPVGDASRNFSSTLGVIAREWVPININSWNKVDATTKATIWDLLMQKYIVDDFHNKFILQVMGKLWRNWKSGLSVQIRDIKRRGSDISRHISLIKPDCVKQPEWEEFVKIRLSDAWKEKSEKMSQVRSQNTLPHTLSRKGYARLEHELKEANPTASPISRVQLWIKGRQQKDGKPINEDAERTIRSLEEENSQHPSIENLSSIKDDAIAKVLGPERPGRVRGLGFGVTPSKVDADLKNNSRFKSLNDKIKEMEEDRKLQMKEMEQNQKVLLNTVMELKRCMMKNGLPDEIVRISSEIPQAQQGSTKNLINAGCKLLKWNGTGQEVACAEIASTDPNALVHHAELGPDCYKVWVKKILIPDVTLFRPTREFFMLEDAVGSTIAWPYKYIRFD